MAERNSPKNRGLKQTTARLTEMQARPGVDTDDNLLLLSLVNLLGIVEVIRQLVQNDGLAARSPRPASNTVGRRGENKNSSAGRVAEFKAVPEEAKPAGMEKRPVAHSTKIMNKLKNKDPEPEEKIIKWDARLKKSNKEPL